MTHQGGGSYTGIDVPTEGTQYFKIDIPTKGIYFF